MKFIGTTILRAEWPPYDERLLPPGHKKVSGFIRCEKGYEKIATAHLIKILCWLSGKEGNHEAHIAT